MELTLDIIPAFYLGILLLGHHISLSFMRQLPANGLHNT
jgi:hypothetical protein